MNPECTTQRRVSITRSYPASPSTFLSRECYLWIKEMTLLAILIFYNFSPDVATVSSVDLTALLTWSPNPFYPCFWTLTLFSFAIGRGGVATTESEWKSWFYWKWKQNIRHKKKFNMTTIFICNVTHLKIIPAGWSVQGYLKYQWSF